MGNAQRINMTEEQKELYYEKCKEDLEKTIKDRKNDTYFWIKWISDELAYAATHPILSYINFSPDTKSPNLKMIYEVRSRLLDWAFNEHKVSFFMGGCDGGSHVTMLYLDGSDVDKLSCDEDVEKITMIIKDIINKRDSDVNIKEKTTVKVMIDTSGLKNNQYSIVKAFNNVKKEFPDIELTRNSEKFYV